MTTTVKARVARFYISHPQPHKTNPILLAGPGNLGHPLDHFVRIYPYAWRHRRHDAGLTFLHAFVDPQASFTSQSLEFLCHARFTQI
jgi:hypothetical protein